MLVIATELSDKEIVGAVEVALSSELDIHLSNIDVEYDSSTGEVTYIITSNDVESLVEISNTMVGENFKEDLSLTGVIIDEFAAPVDIEASVEVIVDVSEVEDVDEAVTAVTQSLLTKDGDFAVSSDVSFVSSAPTLLPSSIPTFLPTTSIPSAAPSLTGLVSIVVATTSTTSDLDAETIGVFTDSVADYYGVNESDVMTTIVYAASGLMTISIPEGTPEQNIVDSVTISIVEALGIHESDVSVVLDMETGIVEFSISSGSYIEAAEHAFDLNSDVSEALITSAIETAIPEGTIVSYGILDTVEASVEFIIDANEAENDLTQAEFLTEQLLDEFDVDIDSKCLGYILTVFSFERHILQKLRLSYHPSYQPPQLPQQLRQLPEQLR